jgi:hypothetical protein
MRRRGEPFREIRQLRNGVCTLDGCGRRAVSTTDYCNSHTYRLERGIPLETPIRDPHKVGGALVRDAQGRKKCRNCKAWLPESAFGFRPKTKDRLYSQCTACYRLRARTNIKGISMARHAEMFEAQGGACAICGRLETPDHVLRIDHDHQCCPREKSCGECVRGLICDPCNVGLGRFRDNPALLMRAIDYLEGASVA